MDLNRHNLEAMREQFRRLFFEVLESNANQGREFVEALGTILPSNASKDTYLFMERTGGLSKFEGEKQLNRFKSHKLSVEADVYEDSLEIDKRDIKRDRMGLYAPGIASMGENVYWHYALLFTQLLEAGHSAECYDGSNFFATDHPCHDGQDTFSNTTDLELSEEAFRTIRLAPTKIVDRNGRRMRIKYNTLFVPTELAEKAKTLNTHEYVQVNPADPSQGFKKNPVKGQFDRIIELEYASSAKRYYAVDSRYTQSVPPLILQLVESPEYSAVTDPDDSHVFKTGKVLHGIECEHGAGYGIPHPIFAGKGITAP